ncbi:MAG: sulfatase-like hydrolase/transferase [Bacteroidetes bacterium]|nr:sulfatase-like hydrolase/transferase [Bacteroidota bacterium]
MKKILIVIILILYSVSSIWAKNSQKGESQKPNILLIFTDDQQWNSIQALGNKNIHTPNMDRMVEGAVVFRNAYCFGGNSGAVCIPSRNMLMSGRNFFRFDADVLRMKANGEKPRKAHYTNPDWPTIPKSMREAGYETYFREKSGSANNPVVRTQFDHFKDIHQVNALRTGRPAQGIIDDAIQFLTTERNPEKPFFMYLGIPAPHDPRWSLKQFRDMYDEEKMPLPENYLPQHPWDIGSMTIRDECLEKWPRTEDAIRRHVFDYYSVITAMDFDFGRLLDIMEEKGLDENTILVFTSDQGLAVGQHGLMGKQNIYEGTMKVPFLVKGPGIEKGNSDAFIYIHDIFPTLCNWAKIAVPEGLDGISFHTILNKKEHKTRENLMLAYMDFQRSVRDERWKLIRFPKIDKTMLFDLKTDPFETNNLAENPEYSNKIAELIEKLEEEGKAQGDTVNLFPGNYAPAKFIAPTKKLPTAFPAGGLAPEDPAYKENNLKQ